MIIYSPQHIKPGKFEKLTAQIDIGPSILGLLNFSYESKFFGQDVLKPDYKPRAFIATYQDLGLIKDNVLTILSPKQEVRQFALKLDPKDSVSSDFQIDYDQTPLKKQKMNLVKRRLWFD